MTVGGDSKVAIGLIAIVVIFVALHLAAAIFAPLALALFIMAVIWPMQKRLAHRLPKLVALLISVVFTLAVVLFFVALVAWSFGRVGRGIIADSARYQAIYEQAVLWLEGHGISVVGLWAEHFNMTWVVSAVRQVAARMNTTLSFWLIAVIYVMLGLLEVDDMHRRIVSLKNRDAVRVLLDGITQTAAKFQQYMGVRSLMSLATGVLVYLLAKVTGLEFAAEWGVVAFVMNYIPFIGPFIATLFPTLFAMAQFGSLQGVLGIFACLNIIQFVVGSYIEPRVAGNALSMSPFIVLFSVFFWTFIWGMFGAFIGVPITIAIITFCAQHPSSRWVSDIIGGSDKSLKQV